MAARTEVRAPLCARISTTNGQSPEMQVRELRECCRRRAWKIVGKGVAHSSKKLNDAVFSRTQLAESRRELLEGRGILTQSDVLKRMKEVRDRKNAT